MTPGATYYVRGYATNSAGTAYGTAQTFTALPLLGAVVITKAVTDVEQTTATSGGRITSDGGADVTAKGVCWSTSATPTTADSKTTDGTDTASFVSNITGLTASTTYYVRAYATNSVATTYGTAVSFTTIAAPVVPTVTTTAVTAITQTTASSGGSISADGGAAVTEKGVCWSTSATPTVADSKTLDGTGTDAFTSDITGLTASTTYYVRAYATNSAGTAYGTAVSFTTLAVPVVPTVTTTAVTAIAQTLATSGGSISADGGAAVTEKGVCWSTSATPTIAGSKTTDGSGTATFTSAITGLTASTTYYVRAYATNSAGTAYGTAVSFTTLAVPVVPTVTTTAVTAITQTTATSGGAISADGGAAVTAKGVCWSTSATPTIAGSKTTDGSGTATFLSAITGLTASTTYYVRAYATNSVGTGYGTAVSFTTSAVPVVPVLTTTAVTAITSTTASSGGNISADGGVAVTAKGVCWSTSATPTITDPKTTDGTGTGAFTSAITGLTTGTTYYVRAYATNSVGTAYGTAISFTTQAIATVTTTTSATVITQTTASSGGTISADGGSAITAKGVCWSTIASPTIADTKTLDGTGTATFTSSITGLTALTTYYVRAYATNGIGTAYGPSVSFTTLPIPVLATTATTAVTAITATTASSGGTISADGGAAITAKGVCWSLTATPTITDSKTTDGTGTATFTSAITGLTPGTTYYVRAYATNSAGTAYGTDVSFTTPSIPTVATTSVATDITQTTATSGGTITSDGDASITAKGVCWSLTASPTVADSKTTDGTGTDAFTSAITGLTPGTTYFVRAYATNIAGTGYAANVSFTTSPATIDLPVLTTTVVSAITRTTATSGGNITLEGGAAVTARGVCWSTGTAPTIADSYTTDADGVGVFVSAITGLTAGTTYYVRAYATNAGGTQYGAAESFTTLPLEVPVLTTTAVTAITQTGGTSGGDVTSDGGAAVTERGICWSLGATPSITDTKIVTGAGTGSYVSAITGLTAGTTYYVSAYATNSVGTAYGTPVSFTTNPLVIPTVTTTAVTLITLNGARSGGNVTSTGGATVTERGICWSTGSTPTITDSKLVVGSGPGSFTATMAGLTVATVYYVRAYAINSVGTGYGPVISFSTPVVPTVTTINATGITQTTANSGGIVSDGGNAVTFRGVCWNTIGNPTTADSKTNNLTGPGSFISTLTGLTASTTYYVRAYATNGVGTAYGSEVSFTTAASAVAPVVSTHELTYIGHAIATAGGSLIADGGDAVTERGVCWSTSSSPSITDNKIVGAATTSFKSAITGLSILTTYYVRAYATNSIGTSYGDEKIFKTWGNPVVDIDGNEYHEVVIGTQTWLVENLKTTRYKNGDPIPDVTDNTAWATSTTGARCWYNNNESLYSKYGSLYNSYVARDPRGIGPEGYHVPTYAETNTLMAFLGGTLLAGGKMKQPGFTDHWAAPNTGATNESGFTAIGSGRRHEASGLFSMIDANMHFWTTNIYQVINGTYKRIHYEKADLTEASSLFSYGASIRCIKD